MKNGLFIHVIREADHEILKKNKIFSFCFIIFFGPFRARRTGIFEVISNDQIEQMMSIKSTKQAVGAGSCNTEACIIDLGNALECEKMLAGKAAFAFGEYSITAKFLDVVMQKYEMSAESKTRDKDDFPDIKCVAFEI